MWLNLERKTRKDGLFVSERDRERKRELERKKERDRDKER